MTATPKEAFSQGACDNCGTVLTGRYCARCGQDSHVSFKLRHFLEEAVEGITHFDSTFWRTFLALLFLPGVVTERYLSGQRRLYGPPVRTYLVVSIVYFVLLSFATSWEVSGVGPTEQEVGPQDCAEFAARMGWLQRFSTDLEGSCLRAQRDHGAALTGAMSGVLPKVMFVVLPLVALVQYWVHRRRRPLYVENLIFVLHFQSFFYLAASLFLLISIAVTAVSEPMGRSLSNGLGLALFLWSAVYLFVAIRRVYATRTFATAMSILALTLAYTIFWAFGVMGASLYALLHS
jgi:hypothetical protein